MKIIMKKKPTKAICNKSRFLSADFYAPFEKPLSRSGLPYIWNVFAKNTNIRE